MRPDRPGAYAEHICDLHVIEALEVEESEACSLPFWQRLDCHRKSFGCLVPFRVILGTPLLPGETFGQVSHPPAFPPLKHVPSEVSKNREEPRPERVSFIKVHHASERPVECFLDKVLCFVHTVGEFQSDRERRAQILAHQSVKRMGITILRELSEFFVRSGREITAHELLRMSATRDRARHTLSSLTEVCSVRRKHVRGPSLIIAARSFRHLSQHSTAHDSVPATRSNVDPRGHAGVAIKNRSGYHGLV
jgi:hypothetical protein